MAFKSTDQIDSYTASAIDLVEKYGDLLIFSRDALDQPPTNSAMVLDENHPAFNAALACTTLSDLLDFLTRACLLGRQGEEDSRAFTHVTSRAAHALALKAMSLNVANVFKGLKNRQDALVDTDKPLTVCSNRIVALVPVFDPGRQKRIDIMHVMDPREGGLDDGKPDPLAAVIAVGNVGSPHEDERYREALQEALAPSKSSLREMQALLRGSLQRYMFAVRMARLQLGILDDSDNSDDGDLN